MGGSLLLPPLSQGGVGGERGEPDCGSSHRSSKHRLSDGHGGDARSDSHRGGVGRGGSHRGSEGSGGSGSHRDGNGLVVMTVAVVFVTAPATMEVAVVAVTTIAVATLVA